MVNSISLKILRVIKILNINYNKNWKKYQYVDEKKELMAK